MSIKKINLANIFLILTSLIIAVIIPFKLFLFSYAVLGPLHYLTEINWLHQKKYFIHSKKGWIIIFIAFAAIITIGPVLSYIKNEEMEFIDKIIPLLTDIVPLILLTAMLFSSTFLFFKKSILLATALALALCIAFLLNTYFSRSVMIFGLFLPTLIHVYIFTFFFILFGAIKSRSKYGLYLAILLLSIPFIISFIPIGFIEHKPSQEVKDTFTSSNMIYISSTIAQLFDKIDGTTFHPLSEIGIRIQIFIAFAYTYHYLNWFSKTSIIGWKKAITAKKGILIGVIWILSVGLYYYDYKTGFIALFFLSYLHVFLELPLNALTIKEVLVFNKKSNT